MLEEDLSVALPRVPACDHALCRSQMLNKNSVSFHPASSQQAWAWCGVSRGVRSGHVRYRGQILGARGIAWSLHGEPPGAQGDLNVPGEGLSCELGTVSRDISDVSGK